MRTGKVLCQSGGLTVRRGGGGRRVGIEREGGVGGLVGWVKWILRRG